MAFSFSNYVFIVSLWETLIPPLASRTVHHQHCYLNKTLLKEGNLPSKNHLLSKHTGDRVLVMRMYGVRPVVLLTQLSKPQLQVFPELI